MKILRVKVNPDLVERIFQTGHVTRDGRVVKDGIPHGFRLEQAQISVEPSGATSLALYFVGSSGEGFEDVSPKLVAGLEDLVP